MNKHLDDLTAARILRRSTVREGKAFPLGATWDGLGVNFIVHIITVPHVSIFREAHAFALDRVGDDRRWPFGVERQRIERVDDFRHVVPVDFFHLESERAPFIDKRMNIDDLVQRPALRDFVVVDDHGEIRETIMRCRHRRFQIRSFVKLAIADHHKRMKIFFLHARAKRHAHGNRESMAECAGTHFDAIHFDIGMHAERRFEGIKFIENLLWKDVALFCQLGFMNGGMYSQRTHELANRLRLH